MTKQEPHRMGFVIRISSFVIEERTLTRPLPVSTQGEGFATGFFGNRMIDTHVHFWDLARFKYGWLSPALPKLYRNFLPDDLVPILKANGVTRAIFVQAHNDLEENCW